MTTITPIGQKMPSVKVTLSPVVHSELIYAKNLYTYGKACWLGQQKIQFSAQPQLTHRGKVVPKFSHPFLQTIFVRRDAFFIFGFYLKVFSTNLVDQMNMIFCLTQLKFLIFGMGRLFAQRRLFVFRNGFRLDDGDAVRWLAEPRYDSSKQKLKAGNGLRKNFTHVRETLSRRFTKIEKKIFSFRKCAKYLI